MAASSFEAMAAVYRISWRAKPTSKDYTSAMYFDKIEHTLWALKHEMVDYPNARVEVVLVKRNSPEFDSAVSNSKCHEATWAEANSAHSAHCAPPGTMASVNLHEQADALALTRR